MPTVSFACMMARWSRTASPLRRPSAVLFLSVLMGLALGGSASLHAQRNWADADWGGGAPGWFDAQAEGSYDEAGRPIALVSVTVPYRNLIFLRQPDGRFRAGYRIRIVQ